MSAECEYIHVRMTGPTTAGKNRRADPNMKKIFQSTSGLLISTFLITAAVMTAYEFTKELIFKGSLSPWESHAITILLTSLMASFTGALLRLRVLETAQKEKTLEIEAQKAVTLKLVLKAVHHILNNFVNHFQLAQLEIEENGRVKEETLEVLRQGFRETKKQLAILEHLDDPSDESKYHRIFPS